MTVCVPFALSFLWYNVRAATPRPAEEGGVLFGLHHIISYLCLGKCNRLLHLQMAGQRNLVGSQPWD